MALFNRAHGCLRFAKFLSGSHLLHAAPFVVSCCQLNPSCSKLIQSVSISHSTTDAADIFCSLLRGGGSWDCLDVRCGSVELSDTLVEEVLTLLKEPNDAKKALLFFHWCSNKRKYQVTLRSYCIMVHNLVCAELHVDARALLQASIKKHHESGGLSITVIAMLLETCEKHLPDHRLFDLLVLCFAKLRMFEAALEACHHLANCGISISLPTFNTLLHLVQRSNSCNMAWKFFEHMLVKRIYPNLVTIEIMVSALCKEGALQAVRDVLDKIHGKRCSPNVVVTTSLAMRMIEDGRSEDVIILLKRLLQKSMSLDDVVYSLIVYAYCKMGQLELAYQAFEEIHHRGHDANSFIYTSLILGNCREGKLEEAYDLLQKMLSTGLKPYDQTYNVLIEFSATMGKLHHSVSLCNNMLEVGFLPSLSACNAMMSKLCADGEVKKANDILTVLLDKGFVPDEVTYSHLINGYGKKGCSHDIMKLYFEMEGKGPLPSLLTYTSAIKSLCRCGNSKQAEKLATAMKNRSLAPSQDIETMLKECKRTDT